MRTRIVILLLIVSCSLSFSCRKDSSKFLENNTGNTEIPDVDHPTEATSEFYFKGKFDNVNALWEAKENGKWSLGTSSSTSVDWKKETIEGRIGPSINYYVTGGTSASGITVEFGVFSTSIDLKKSAVKSLLKTGLWDFSTPSTNTPDFKNVGIIYTSNDKVMYGTDGDQTGSKFELLSVTVIPATLYFPENYKIKFKFNCKLYPLDSQSANKEITLTDAEGTLAVENNL